MKIRLQSNAMCYAPGVIAYAQSVWRGGDHDTALAIVNAWPGIPAAVARRIAAGDVVSYVDDNEALVVTSQPEDAP